MQKTCLKNSVVFLVNEKEFLLEIYYFLKIRTSDFLKLSLTAESYSY